MRKRTAVGTCALLGLLIVTGAAVGQDEPAAGGKAAERTVKLLDAGTGPKRELRYALKPGMAGALAMEIKTSVKVAVGGQQVQAADLPTMRLTLRAAVTEVQAGGDSMVTLEIADAGIVERPDTPQNFAHDVERMRLRAAQLKGLKGTATLSARGLITGLKIDAPAGKEGDEEERRQVIRDAEQHLVQFTTALPAEPVGTGARWEVAMPFETSGITMDSTDTHTLKALTDGEATLDLTMRQTAGRQKLTGATLERLEGSGAGTLTMRFDRLPPVKSAFESNGKLTMDIGQGQPLVMDIKTTVAVSPAEEK